MSSADKTTSLKHELIAIPPQHRPTGPIERTAITTFDCWLSREQDPIGILFGDQMPAGPYQEALGKTFQEK